MLRSLQPTPSLPGVTALGQGGSCPRALGASTRHSPPFLCTELISISSAETSAVCKWARLLPLDDLAPTLPVQAGKIHCLWEGAEHSFCATGVKNNMETAQAQEKSALSSHRTAQLSLPTAWKKSPLLLMLATSRAVAGKHTRAEPRTY